MDMKNKTWIIAGVVIVLVVLWLGGSYNSLVTKGEAVTTQWAQVETSYQRRFDLIPNGRYNEKVQAYNVVTKRFPSSVVASLFGFDEKNYFKANEAAATAPQVKF